MTDPSHSHSDLRRLAERIRSGDVGAFDELLHAHWAAVVRYTASIVGSVEDARDVAQEAFSRVWEQRSGLRASGSLRAYVYQIARNLALNERRRRDLHRTLAAQNAAERPVVRTPDVEVEADELRALVERAIEALPERRREAFVLAHLQNLPHREIAEVMGISPQTVANQISAALTDLRIELAPWVRNGDTDGLGRLA